MKKLLLLLAITVSLNCYSQVITVNTNAYTVPDLVNTVLINSPCVSATNITWKTGTNFSSSNGIGFFQNSNSNFPIKSGVILSTGNANNAVGPNTTQLNDGAANWPGDSDLESTLAKSGIIMNSVNATILEFDFTPISPNFNFEFLFASEEYGNFQCQFSDAFAFLLTNNSTGVTTNLAVVPSTTLPISVVTIRDYLYNSSCPSENEQYFGTYNGGSSATSSPTNFNGQTKLLNASATLALNTTYHIKLVIADRSDSSSDSAIFIASDSFNIGQAVLGNDILISNNNALCSGDDYVINSGLNPSDYTLSWKKDGVTISGATGPSLTVTQSGTYEITYQKKSNGCIPVSDSIIVEYLPKVSTQNPKDLFKCITGATSYTYDLSINTAIVKTGLDSQTKVSYHISNSDAENNTNALPNNYSCDGNQTVYVRINTPNNPCPVVKSFKLSLTPAPVANKPSDLIKCSGNNKSIFNLTTQKKDILLNQSDKLYSINFYNSLADATNDKNVITLPQNFQTVSTTIYARVQLITDSSCYAITDFKIIVSPTPIVDKIESVVLCESYILPALTNGNYFTESNGKGTPLFAGDIITKTQTIYIFNQPDGPQGCSASSNFEVKIIDPSQLSPQGGTFCGKYNLPPISEGNYFTEAGGLGTQLKPGAEILTSQKVYVYFKSITPPFCVIDTDFDIIILPTVDVGKHDNVFDCTSYTLPSLTIGDYYTEADGGGIKLKAGDIITTTQTIFVYAINTDGCKSQDSFSVVIGIEIPTDISQCEPYTLPSLAVGNYYTGPNGTGNIIPSGTSINLTQEIYIYVPTGKVPNCTNDIHFNIAIAQPIIDVLTDVSVCESYTLPSLTSGEYYSDINGTGTKLDAGSKIFTSQTVYIYKQSLTSDCSNQSSFMVNINSKPIIDSRADIDICNFYILTTLENGEYYTGPNGTGTKLVSGTKITTSQMVYIFAAANSTSPCTSENSFRITIYPIEADSLNDVTVCDSYKLPVLTIGNYYSISGGSANNGESNLLHAGDVITNSTTLYIFAESGERINCTDENIFNITIIKSPVISPISDVNTCNSYTLPALTIGNYFTGTNGTGSQLNEGDILTTNQIVYVFAETGTTPNCTDEKSFNVNLFNVDELNDVTICDSYTLPNLNVGNYYTGPSGTGSKLQAGQQIKNTQMIYIFAKSTFNPSCTDESSFTVTKVVSPVVNSISSTLTTVCDEDGNNDGVFAFDLTQLNSAVLGNQTSSEYKVEYFATQADALVGTNPILSTNLQTVYVRVSNTLALDCFDLKSLNIIVNKLPEVTPNDGIICFDSKTNTLLNPYTIESGLSSSNYTFEWFNDNDELIGNQSNYLAVEPGIYTVIATSKTTGCSSEATPVIVSPSEPAVVTYTMTDDFSDNQVVTVVATGNGGVYEYKLDSGAFQDSPIFDNVSSGIHTITVRDKNGCGTSSTEALVVKYPKFFTPNGDGYNDTWNIVDLQNQSNAIIYIYDRYGKLLTNIRPSGQGWDGSYSGKSLPSTDYWFTVNYTEDNQTKEFRSHFSMKR